MHLSIHGYFRLFAWIFLPRFDLTFCIFVMRDVTMTEFSKLYASFKQQCKVYILLILDFYLDLLQKMNGQTLISTPLGLNMWCGFLTVRLHVFEHNIKVTNTFWLLLFIYTSTKIDKKYCSRHYSPLYIQPVYNKYFSPEPSFTRQQF